MIKDKKEEFITDQSSFTLSPISKQHLGRYKCTATNKFGASSSSFIRIDKNPKIGENYDSIVYAFIENEIKENNTPLVSHLKSKIIYDKQILDVKPRNRIWALNKSVSLDCLQGNFQILLLRF